MGEQSMEWGQEWAAKDASDRRYWFMRHGDEMADARAELAAALRKYADTVKSIGAADRRDFDPVRFVEGALDFTDYPLAPEVREYLDI